MLNRPQIAFLTAFLPTILLAGCGTHSSSSGSSSQSLVAARAGYATHLTRQTKTPDPIPQPHFAFVSPQSKIQPIDQ